MVTFLVTRKIVRKIKAGEGNLKDNVVGGVHIHHAVPGLVLMVVSGLTALGAQSIGWRSVAGVGFGIGLALVLDEFALILHLQDVYWSEQGRTSVNAVLLVAGVIVLVLLGASPANINDPTVGNGIFLVVAVNLGFVAICFMKGKLGTGVIGIVTPFIALVGTFRLARPHSAWAKRRYPEGSHKLDRAIAREVGVRRPVALEGPRPSRTRSPASAPEGLALGARASCCLVGLGDPGQELVADRHARLPGLSARDPPAVATRVEQRRLLQAAQAGGHDAPEHQLVVGHGGALEDLGGEPRDAAGHDRVAVDLGEVLGRHVAELPARDRRSTGPRRSGRRPAPRR